MEPFSRGDSNAARIMHHGITQATQPHASTLATEPAASTSEAGLAPSVPKGVHAKAQKLSFQLGHKLRAIHTDPTMTPAEAIIAAADEWAKTVKSLQSPLTELARMKSLADWSAFLSQTNPELSYEKYWDRNVVEANWKRFLFVKVHTGGIFFFLH